MPHAPASNQLGLPFSELSSVDSTNNYALARIHAGLTQHGEAFFAYEQVAGKGQMGKTWASQAGQNIILSIVVNPQPLQLSQQFQLSGAVAVAIHDFFCKYAGDDTRIKWPNDLYWQDRKAGGVLIESIVGGDKPEAVSHGLRASSEGEGGNWKWAVIGIGININQTVFPDDLINAVSLKQITGKNFDTVNLAKELCAFIDHRFTQLLVGGFEEIYNQYISRLYKKDETVKLKKDNRVFDAKIKTVSPSGQLVVQHSIEEEFGFAQVEWVVRKL